MFDQPVCNGWPNRCAMVGVNWRRVMEIDSQRAYVRSVPAPGTTGAAAFISAGISHSVCPLPALW